MEAFLLQLQRASGNAAVAQLLAATAETTLPPEMTAPYHPGAMAKAYWETSPEERADIDAATDDQFQSLTGITRKLNWNNPRDRPAARMWLRLRDQEMSHPRVRVEIGPVEILPASPTTGPAAPTFSNPLIQKVFEDNGSKGSSNQLAALHILDTPRKGPWSQLKWDDVAVGAARRIYHPELINQEVLGVCGPAAALEGEAATQAVGYATEIAQVFETGKAGGVGVNKELLGKAPGGGLDPSDWMMLTAIQNAGNYVLEYHGEEGDSWRAGLTDGQIEFALKEFSGSVKTKKYSCAWWGVMDQTVTINGLMSTYGDDVVVVMAVDSDLMVGKKKNEADHAIRLVSPAIIHDGKVTINIFTWGSNRTYTYDEKTFKQLVYSYIVGARKDSVALP